MKKAKKEAEKAQKLKEKEDEATQKKQAADVCFLIFRYLVVPINCVVNSRLSCPVLSILFTSFAPYLSYSSHQMVASAKKRKGAWQPLSDLMSQQK